MLSLYRDIHQTSHRLRHINVEALSGFTELPPVILGTVCIMTMHRIGSDEVVCLQASFRSDITQYYKPLCVARAQGPRGVWWTERVCPGVILMLAECDKDARD